jgi:hypothetical protein
LRGPDLFAASIGTWTGLAGASRTVSLRSCIGTGRRRENVKGAMHHVPLDATPSSSSYLTRQMFSPDRRRQRDLLEPWLRWRRLGPLTCKAVSPLNVASQQRGQQRGGTDSCRGGLLGFALSFVRSDPRRPGALPTVRYRNRIRPICPPAVVLRITLLTLGICVQLRSASERINGDVGGVLNKRCFVEGWAISWTLCPKDTSKDTSGKASNFILASAAQHASP